MLKSINPFLRALVDRKLMPTAIKVALVVGTILLMINHGSAIMQGKMTRDRAISALLTYFVPYTVNIHGQYISRAKSGG